MHNIHHYILIIHYKSCIIYFTISTIDIHHFICVHFTAYKPNIIIDMLYSEVNIDYSVLFSISVKYIESTVTYIVHVVKYILHA